MPIARLKDIDLYYEVHGEGEPLLLIAGLASDCQSWQLVINGLSKQFKLIIFDNRGIGRSSSVELPYTIKHLADDINELLNYLNIEAAHILGHSMGGFIAQELAINYPHRIYKLILESTAPFSSKRNNYLFENMLKALESGIDYDLWIRNFLFWIYTPKLLNNKRNIENLVQFVMENPYPQSNRSFQQQIEATSNFNSTERLYKVEAETLVLIGEEDILIKPKESELLYQGISRATYPVYIEKAAHANHNENPKAFIHAVISFIYKYVR